MATDVKNQIAETFVRHARKVGMDKVTINAIVTELHISRQAFYYYYQDIVDVARYVLREGLTEALEVGEKTESPQEAVRIFSERLAEHFPTMAVMLNSKFRNEMEILLIKEMTQFFYTIFSRECIGRGLSRKQIEFQSDFIACGLAAYSIEHCNDLKFDVDEFAQMLWDLLSRTYGGE